MKVSALLLVATATICSGVRLKGAEEFDPLAFLSPLTETITKALTKTTCEIVQALPISIPGKTYNVPDKEIKVGLLSANIDGGDVKIKDLKISSCKENGGEVELTLVGSIAYEHGSVNVMKKDISIPVVDIPYTVSIEASLCKSLLFVPTGVHDFKNPEFTLGDPTINGKSTETAEKISDEINNGIMKYVNEVVDDVAAPFISDLAFGVCPN